MRRYRRLHMKERLFAWTCAKAMFCSCIFIAFVQCLDGNATPATAAPESGSGNDYPLSEPIWKGRNLGGNISADRPLDLRDLDLLLRLSRFLIDKRNDGAKRGTAAGNLGALGHQYAIPALLAVIRDEEDNSDVRARATIALSQIRDKRVVDYLIDMLDENLTAHYQLIKITGAGIGFGVEHDTAVKRQKLQAEWRTWWNKNRERAYLRSRTHALNSHPVFFWSVEMWRPSLLRPNPPPLKIPRENHPERRNDS